MEAIRYQKEVESDSLFLEGLSKYKGKQIEVIIMVDDYKKVKKNKLDRKKEFFKFAGAISSGYNDTSERVDELVYEK